MRVLIFCVALGLTACNTVEGAKKDVAIGAEKTGHALHKTGEVVGEALNKTGEVVGGAIKKGGEAVQKVVD